MADAETTASMIWPSATSATLHPFSEVLQHAPGAKKSDKTFAQVPLDKATEYAGEDADVTLRLWMVLKPRLAVDGMTAVYETLERPLVGILAAMERAGVKVDRSILSRLQLYVCPAHCQAGRGNLHAGRPQVQFGLGPAARRIPVR
jgi:DNA polymerase I-like protein with 3'-5' exonuclease and polymerase domains